MSGCLDRYWAENCPSSPIQNGISSLRSRFNISEPQDDKIHFAPHDDVLMGDGWQTTLEYCYSSATFVFLDFFGKLHNNLMASDNPPAVKIFAVIGLEVANLVNTLLAIVETVIRLALATLLLPTMYCQQDFKDSAPYNTYQSFLKTSSVIPASFVLAKELLTANCNIPDAKDLCKKSG